MKGKERLGILCKPFYRRAVEKKSSRVWSIPGIIDVTQPERWTITYPEVISIMVM